MPATKISDSGRLERMISLAYLLSTRSEIHIEELEERLSINRKTLEEDLNVLMFCGLPPYSPEQLFDIIIDEDYVSMLYNDVFVKPLRLTKNELTQSIVALESLILAEPNQSELIKETLSLINADHEVPISIEDENNEYLRLAIKGSEKNKPLDIEYLSLNSASISNRTIDVIKIFTTASLSYIFGYCHKAKSVRVFRSDRIISASINETKSIIYNPKDSENITELYSFDNEDDFVELHINETHNWILDSYPHEQLGENEYRFYTSSPFFVARILLSAFPGVTYVSSSFEKSKIINAIETITDRM